MRQTVFAAAFGLTLLLGAPAHAQTAEAEVLGVQVARTIFQAISFDKLIAKEIGGTTDAFGAIKSRPEWNRYLVEAMQEEVRHDLPLFETMFGRALAKDMTVEELRAGATLLADPALQAMIKQAAEGGPEPADRPSRETERLAATSAGRSFLTKLTRIEERLEPLQDEFAVELVPGAFRRFADKAEAGEAARRQGQPPTVK